MKPYVSMIALGVSNLARARKFYESGLGWTASPISNDAVVFIQCSNMVLGLTGAGALAEDAQLPPRVDAGFRGTALAHNVGSREEVDAALELVRRAGGTILKEARDASWGGYSGYFSDPDGHVWEVAWNPHFELTAEGIPRLP